MNGAGLRRIPAVQTGGGIRSIKQTGRTQTLFSMDKRHEVSSMNWLPTAENDTWLGRAVES